MEVPQCNLLTSVIFAMWPDRAKGLLEWSIMISPLSFQGLKGLLGIFEFLRVIIVITVLLDVTIILAVLKHRLDNLLLLFRFKLELIRSVRY